MKKQNIKLLIGIITILLTIIITAAMVLTFIYLPQLKNSSSELIYAYGIPALFLLSLLLDLGPQYVSPIAVEGIAILAGINLYYVITATIIGSAIGSSTAYYLGKKYMFKAVDILTSKKDAIRLTHLTNKYGKAIIAIAAISPLPYLPVVIGAANCSKKNFIIYGLIPRATSFIIYGLIISIF
ncbi:MAG: VTT domain-containing protein [Nanoarchaeota archaeon]|nr:VTT domain-containing protein [Nanoarchaeota archaeon]